MAMYGSLVTAEERMLELLAPRGLGPEVAVITNLTPNHLDRHGTMEAYGRAKAGILVSTSPADMGTTLVEAMKG